MNRNTIQPFVILASLTAGVLLHAHLQAFAGVVKYLLFLMLLLTFTRLEIRRDIFRPLHARLLLAQFGIALAAWALLRPFHPELAMAAFMVGVTPTATAAPVITGFLGGEVGVVAAAVFSSNLAVAVLIPFLLPCVVPPGVVAPGVGAVSVWPVLQNLLGVVVLPLLLTRGSRRLLPRANDALARLRPLSFYLWAMVLIIVTAKSADFVLTHPEVPRPLVAAMAGLALVICAANFALGRRLGGREHALEGGQSLGQKNTALTIWLSLAFVSPLVALGPTFYVVWHNLFNSWQLWRKARRHS